MSYYIVIRGPAGVGKTTIAKLLKSKLDANYISFDDVLRENKLEISDGRGICKESFLKANELVIPDAKRSLCEGKIVIFDGCFYHQEQLGDLERELNFEHYIFDIKASIGECIKRDKGRRSIGEDAIKAVYEMVAEFEVGIPINTGGKTEEEIVREIMLVLL